MWRQREASPKAVPAAVEPLREVRSPAAPVRRVTSAIGPTIRITGTVVSHEDLTIHGTVNGPIVVEKRLIVLEGGSVDGNLDAQAITIAGTVTGQVDAIAQIEIESTGQVVGDLTAPRIAVRDGAVIAGRIDTTVPMPAVRHFPIAV